MTDSALPNNRLLTASDFFSRARDRLTFDVPAGFADPKVIPPHDQPDADPAVIAAIAAVRPIRLAAVLVPLVLLPMPLAEVPHEAMRPHQAISRRGYYCFQAR